MSIQCAIYSISHFVVVCLLRLKDTHRFFVDGESFLEVDNAETDVVCSRYFYKEPTDQSATREERARTSLHVYGKIRTPTRRAVLLVFGRVARWNDKGSYLEGEVARIL